MTTKAVDSIKTINKVISLNASVNTESIVKRTYTKIVDSIFTILSYAAQPATVLAYAVTEFLPITNIPINLGYLAFDDGFIIAFDDGCSIGYTEI